MATVNAKSDRIFELVDAEPTVETLGTGYGFTEGPLWNAAEGALYFSDLVQDKRRRWVAASNSVEEVAAPSYQGNGMTYDAAGNLLVCEHTTSSVARFDSSGSREVLASHWGDKELNSPNDIVTAKNGSTYFTDPPYGRVPGWGVERPQDLDFQGVFRIAAGGALELLADDFEGPNGICLATDESILYVNDSAKAHVRAFDVADDGTVSNGRVFVEGIGRGVPEEGVPDGMKCDQAGNIWVTGPGGIWIFDSGGEHLGVIELGSVANFTWGGADWSTLFIAGFVWGGDASIYRMPTKTKPHKEPYM